MPISACVNLGATRPGAPPLSAIAEGSALLCGGCCRRPSSAGDLDQLPDRGEVPAVAAEYQVGDEPGPAGLVRRAEAGAVVAVEVLEEEDVVLPLRVGLEPVDPAEARP